MNDKIFYFLTLLFCSVLQANNKIIIQGTFLESNDHSLIVLEKFEVGSRVILSTHIEKGSFKFELPFDIEPGIYRLKYNEKEPNAFIDVIINGKENLIEFIYNCKETNSSPSFTNNSENAIYYNFFNQQNKMLDALSVKKFFIQNYPNVEEKAYKKIEKSYVIDILKIKKIRSEFLEKHKNFFWASNLILNKPIFIPTDLKKDEKMIAAEKYEKYWYSIDASNPKLLNTPIFSDDILGYLHYYLNSNRGLTNEEIETGLKQSVDKILTHFSTNEATQKFAILYLLKGFQEIGMHQIVAYIDEKYQPLIRRYGDQSQIDSYESRITSYKKLKPGTLSPNIEWKEANKEKSSLHQIKAKEMVLVFWSSECSQCEEIMKKLDDWALVNKNKIVIAIGIETDTKNYFEAIKNFKNILFYSDFKGFDSTIIKEYAINATPTFYIIDENKIIIKKYDYYPF